MRAMVIDRFGGPEQLYLKEMSKPHPHLGEVLIKVAYAGVNPVDWKIREGYLHERMPHKFPLILGWDAAGVVENTGEAVFVYARKEEVQWGTYAEYLTVKEEHIAKKPKTLSMREAAALPLVSLTAWQALFDKAHLQPTDTLLILGASGGVGAMALQFAKYAGATVFATASAEKCSYVESLGADRVYDYKSDYLSRLANQVDCVFDAVGGDLFFNSLKALKKGGRIVSLLEKIDLEEAKEKKIQAFYLFVSPNGEQLTKIAQLIDEKRVIPPPVQELPLSDAATAQERVRAGQVLGKLVLKI